MSPMNYKIKDLPLDERPREKLKEKGAENISNEELIAILLRTGSKEESVKNLAIQVVKNLNHFKDLNSITYRDLMKIKGIKEAKALTLIAAIELGRRLATPEKIEKLKVTNAIVLYEYFRLKILNSKQEKLFAVFLNTKNEVITYETIFVGTQNKSITHPREIFNAAIKNSAVKLILLHNHPTGDTTPSEEDIYFTKRIKEAGALLQIPLIDHLIISETEYFSFFDHEML